MCNDDLRSEYLVPPIGRLLHKLSTRMIKFNCHYYFIIFFLRLLLYRTHAHATLNFYRFNFGLDRTYSEEITNVQKKKKIKNWRVRTIVRRTSCDITNNNNNSSNIFY